MSEQEQTSVQTEKSEGTRKLFVGNVPFSCTKEEFEECFRNREGFLECDIVTNNNNSSMTRGFGFVVVDTDDNAEKLLNEEIYMGERNLRLANYQNVEERRSQVERTHHSGEGRDMGDRSYRRNRSNDNKVFVRNIPLEVTEEVLGECFGAFGTIKKCFVNAPTNPNHTTQTGVVIFENRESAVATTLKKDISILDAVVNVFQYRKNFSRGPHVNPNYYNLNEAYREGYNAGKLVGYENGKRDAIEGVQT